MTNQRLRWHSIAPQALEAMTGLENYSAANVEPVLYELVKLRASLINGCAFCVDMHSAEALKAGENLQRLMLLGQWREAAHLYTEREQAALALTEAATRLDEHGVPDDVWDAAAAQFSEKELVDLVAAIATINAWNRFGVTLQLHVAHRA